MKNVCGTAKASHALAHEIGGDKSKSCKGLTCSWPQQLPHWVKPFIQASSKVTISWTVPLEKVAKRRKLTPCGTSWLPWRLLERLQFHHNSCSRRALPCCEPLTSCSFFLKLPHPGNAGDASPADPSLRHLLLRREVGHEGADPIAASDYDIELERDL